MCVQPLSKILDLTDKYTCQYMIQAVYLLTATYYKIAQQDSFKVITIVTAIFNVGSKNENSHINTCKPITTFVR